MPDKRKHRGAHPDDARLFAAQTHAALRRALAEYAWLLTRGYADASSLKLVGDRYNLTARQRLAIWRCACPDEALERRAKTVRSLLDARDARLGIDGYNLLITVESALAGGVVFVGRDGCARDLAGIHGTYRKVDETVPALALIAGRLADTGATAVDWYLDRPVSNSGRLKVLMAEWLEARGMRWNIELVNSPDRTLADHPGPIVSTDGWILDRCDAWINLARDLIQVCVPDAWVVDLRSSAD